MIGTKLMCCPRCGSENLIKAFSWRSNGSKKFPRISCVGCYWAVEETAAALFEMVCIIEYERFSNGV